ncbi:hypothetical protein BRYFOR_09425 [Marvinbryantia formatexigens DSM 14469]|uniref:Uncharacterized protein n=1 Tax=Marvinbryantia formatexigens DSM 14469 TaxID=478749 RepID=C6LL78_9FIRM|nr:hypothetical protein BRYFOR_09425 [Marvinbryantia formatexigens DSM 14469]
MLNFPKKQCSSIVFRGKHSQLSHMIASEALLFSLFLLFLRFSCTIRFLDPH